MKDQIFYLFGWWWYFKDNDIFGPYNTETEARKELDRNTPNCSHCGDAELVEVDLECSTDRDLSGNYWHCPRCHALTMISRRQKDG